MLKKFFSYYKPHKRLFIIDFSSAVFVAILELAFPVAVQRFIDDLLPTKDWSMITQISILLLVVYIISTFLQYVVSYFGHKLGINIETDMRQELFTHVQRQSFRFFDNTKTGHIMSRITNDLFDIGELAHHGPEDLFIAFMTVIG
ncbi:MAG: ABC transporter transmembrane domain-containing protein, partial [Psychrobacillus psychrodurans]